MGLAYRSSIYKWRIWPQVGQYGLRRSLIDNAYLDYEAMIYLRCFEAILQPRLVSCVVDVAGS